MNMPAGHAVSGAAPSGPQTMLPPPEPEADTEPEPFFAAVEPSAVSESDDSSRILTITNPFIPAAACATLVERYSKFPLPGSSTLRVVVAPGAIIFVATPVHEFTFG